MTPQQIELVQGTWAKVAPIADQAAGIFYDRLFQTAPDVRPLFAADITRQKRALMAMLATAVNGLSDLERILPAVQALGHRHASYGVRDDHYGVVGAALLYTLGMGLGDEFSPEVEAAWTAAYVTLASVMKEAATQKANA